jgi:hypothetical protein
MANSQMSKCQNKRTWEKENAGKAEMRVEMNNNRSHCKTVIHSSRTNQRRILKSLGISQLLMHHDWRLANQLVKSDHRFVWESLDDCRIYEGLDKGQKGLIDPSSEQLQKDC